MQALSAPSPLARLALTPHRAFFTAGVLALLAISAWWAMVLARPGPAAYPPALVHGLMMPLGVFPLFMLGFLFTAGPRWLNVSHTRAPYPIALTYIAGVLLALIGFHLGGPWPRRRRRGWSRTASRGHRRNSVVRPRATRSPPRAASATPRR